MSADFNLNFKTNISTDDASKQQALADIDEVENANRAMLSNVRQGFQIGLFAITAMGAAVDQSLSLLIEAVFLSIEVALAIEASTFGIGTVLKGGTALSMFYLIYRIRVQKIENNTQVNAFVSGLRLVSYR